MMDIALRFLDLVLKYEAWDVIRALPEEEMQTLFDVVVAAGFKPGSVVSGTLKGYYLEQDGSRTGKTYPINGFCLFKVVDQEGGDHYFATGWLDCLFRFAVSGFWRKDARDELARSIMLEIERSVPLEPLQITIAGDELHEYPSSLQAFGFEYFVKHTRDQDLLNCCVGVHGFCGGFMDRVRATRTHDAIYCRRCSLRTLFPRGVKTYGELRKVMTAQLRSDRS